MKSRVWRGLHFFYVREILASVRDSLYRKKCYTNNLELRELPNVE